MLHSAHRLASHRSVPTTWQHNGLATAPRRSRHHRFKIPTRYIIFEPLPHSVVAHFGQLVELTRTDVVAHQQQQLHDSLSRGAASQWTSAIKAWQKRLHLLFVQTGLMNFEWSHGKQGSLFNERLVSASRAGTCIIKTQRRCHFRDTHVHRIRVITANRDLICRNDPTKGLTGASFRIRSTRVL